MGWLNSSRVSKDRWPKPVFLPCSDGGLVIARKVRQEYHSYRVYDLAEAEVNHKALMSHPLSLAKMAAFLQQAHFQVPLWDQRLVAHNVLDVGSESCNALPK